jgi:phage terminase small subunit
MRGRKPKPTMLADLHGRPSKDKAPPYEPKPVGDLAEAPDWFSPDQQQGWRYAISHAPPGLLKRIDRGVLAAWIIAEDLHRQATVAQNKMGTLLVNVGPKEAPVPQQSYYLPIINRQAQIMIRAAGELGFSPVARPRISAAPSLPPIVSKGSDAPITPKRSLDEFIAGHPQTRH